MDRKKMAELLSRKRKEMGLTQQELGELLHVSYQAVSRWEQGENLPDIQFIEELSHLYHLSIEEILNGEEKPIISEELGQEIKKENTPPKKTKEFISNHILRIIIDGASLLAFLLILLLPFIEVTSSHTYFPPYGSITYHAVISGYGFIFDTHFNDFFAWLADFPIMLGMILVPLSLVILDATLFITYNKNRLYNIAKAGSYVRFFYLILLIILLITHMSYVTYGFYLYCFIMIVLVIINLILPPLKASFYNNEIPTKNKNLQILFFMDVIYFVLIEVVFAFSFKSNLAQFSSFIQSLIGYLFLTIVLLFYLLKNHRYIFYIFLHIMRFIIPTITIFSMPLPEGNNFYGVAMVVLITLEYIYAFIMLLLPHFRWKKLKNIYQEKLN